MALTKVTGQVINNTTDLVVGVTTVGGGVSAVDGFFSGIVTFSNDVSIAGTLTYEDVTNIDAVGLVTARNGIVVGSGITLSKDGDGFFTGIVTATQYYGDGSTLSNVTSTTINDNGTSRIITGSGTANTLNAKANLIFDNTSFKVGSGVTISKGGDGFFTGVVTATSYAGDGSNLTGVSAGILTEAASISGITTYLDLTKDDHELVVTGTNTISVIGGAQGSSHTLRLQNSGIATITLDSTYFKFASGGTPAFPTTDGAISLVSFTIHKAGAVGVNTVLLTGVSVSFS